ncbi:MAG: hypothetical protein RIF39_02855, partial [Cyclobacteriaceae bacterium]
MKRDYAQWQANKERLAKVYQMSDVEKKTLGIDVEKLEREASLLERTLSKISLQFGELLTARPTWRAVQQKLRDDEAAVAIIR